MSAILEAHGGSVEKFIGDAVMAVFGVPVAHEDDALRACRAAVEMRDALPELGIVGRVGVNTGPVVTGTEERLATPPPRASSTRRPKPSRRRSISSGVQGVSACSVRPGISPGRIAAPVATTRWS